MQAKHEKQYKHHNRNADCFIKRSVFQFFGTFLLYKQNYRKKYCIIMGKVSIEGVDILSEYDIVLTVYIIFMVLALVVSIKYASIMMKKTGLFLAQVIIAGTIHFVLGVIAIIAWIVITFSTNEMIFFGGVFLGICMIVIGEILLVTIVLMNKKKWVLNN